MFTDRLWLHICKLNVFVPGIDEVVQADRYVSWKHLRSGIQPLTLQCLGNCLRMPELSKSVQQMGAETTVQPTEAGQNGLLTDHIPLLQS
jgi:hypothetical protein